MFGRPRWALSKTHIVTASIIVLAVFCTPTFVGAANLGTVTSVTHGGKTMVDNESVFRSDFSSITNNWTFNFSWPSPVANNTAMLAVIRGTFGNIAGGTPQSGVNFDANFQAWATGTNNITKSIGMPPLGGLTAQSGTYTLLVAHTNGAFNQAGTMQWFASGGTAGQEPVNYRLMTFTYSATDVATELPGALSSIQYGPRQILPSTEVPQEEVTPNVPNPSQFWRFNFTWPNAVTNQQALLAVFKGTYGALEGGAPLAGTNYAATVQAWAAGANNLGKFMSLPGLESENAAGTYTVMIAERDPKFSANPLDQEALWFSSGGTQGVAPRKYSLLTFTLTNPPKCCSSVLFLPGIMGSRLYDGSEKLWEPDNESDVQALYLDQTGKSIGQGVVASEVLDTYDGPGPINPDIYKSLLEDLAEKDVEETIEDYVAYAYDWRLSLPDILADGDLEAQLRALAQDSHTEKVTIVAHSNGGLLAKALINELGPEAASLVDTLVLVAVPQLGTPQAIGALLHGYDSGILTQYSEARARDFAHNALFAYHLLPHHDFFNFSGGSITTPLAIFEAGESTTPFIDLYDESINTIPELKLFLLGAEGRATPTFFDLKNPSLGNSALLADAGQYLDTIDSYWQPPAGIAVHQIAGVGERTLTGIAYKDGYTSCTVWQSGQSSTPQCLEYFNGVLYAPVTAIDGDGTVVTPSALAMPDNTNTKRWWVNLSQFNEDGLGQLSGIRFLRTKHGDLLEVPDVRKLILDEILESYASPYTYVSDTQPTIEGEDRLEFTLHSPLDMWLVDSFGNEVSSTTAGISGASYNRYGEVQVITVPKGAPVSLKMLGTELGIFSLEVKEYAGGTQVGTVAFAGVPTTDSTSVLLNLPTATVAGTEALKVDYQSDGMPDLVLEPVLNETVTPDVTPPVTSAELSGVKGENNWYKSNIEVVLTAIDESGVAETWYALDNEAFTQGTSTVVSGEGAHTLRFYSVDNQGNAEEEKTQEVRIDSIASEVVLSASTNGKDLLIVGLDTQLPVLVTTTGTTTQLTDEAGNVATLAFKKTYTGSRLTYAKLESIQYNDGPVAMLPSSFTFIWDKAGILTSQTIVVDSQFIVQALYDKKKNKTSIVVLKKNAPIKVTTLTGLVLVKLTTGQGQVTYSW